MIGISHLTTNAMKVWSAAMITVDFFPIKRYAQTLFQQTTIGNIAINQTT